VGEDGGVFEQWPPGVHPRDVPDDAVLVDVREADEWAEERVPSSLHLPMSEFVARQGELPAARRLYVLCHVGARSARVAAYLQQQGVDAVNVEGGLVAWEAAGRPIVYGSEA
jgi:rhodanese-related sulfurtransferase